jgi:hypothetical protein
LNTTEGLKTPGLKPLVGMELLRLVAANLPVAFDLIEFLAIQDPIREAMA